MAINLSTAQVIYAAQTKLLELAELVATSTSFKRSKPYIQTGEALIRYIRVLQTDGTLTIDEQTAICQHMITIGNLYDFAASPTITSNEIFNFSANAEVGPQGPQGEPGRDGGGTDYNQFSLTATGTIDSFSSTDANAAEWSYVVKDGSNLRSGRVGAVWLADGSSIKPYEYSTMDIGDTSPISFDVDYSGGLIRLRATITSGTWDVRGTRYFVPNNGVGVIVQSTALPTGKILIGNSSNQAAAQSVSGDIALNSAGVASISSGVIVNGDISSSAAIGLSKLAPLTASKALVTNSSGVIVVKSDVTDTQIGHLSNVHSDIQTQLDSKLSAATGAISTVVSSDLTASKVVVSNSSGKVASSSVSSAELGHLTGTNQNINSRFLTIENELVTKLKSDPYSSTDDVDTMTSAGFQYVGTSALNIPVSAKFLLLIAVGGQTITANGDVQQIAIQVSGTGIGDIYWRSKAFIGSWSSWTLINDASA